MGSLPAHSTKGSCMKDNAHWCFGVQFHYTCAFSAHLPHSSHSSLSSLPLGVYCVRFCFNSYRHGSNLMGCLCFCVEFDAATPSSEAQMYVLYSPFSLLEYRLFFFFGGSCGFSLLSLAFVLFHFSIEFLMLIHSHIV